MPWSAYKVGIKSLKHGVWIVFALWTGFTFVGYFTPILELAQKITSFSTGPWETFWVVFYAFATYGNVEWMCEQACIYMCPYVHFQSAMFSDYHPMMIDAAIRGVHADPATQGLGHCIDCTLRVQVCPTGIDICDDLEHKCIGCAACIDACDGVIDKMHLPQRLDTVHH